MILVPERSRSPPVRRGRRVDDVRVRRTQRPNRGWLADVPRAREDGLFGRSRGDRNGLGVIGSDEALLCPVPDRTGKRRVRRWLWKPRLPPRDGDLFQNGRRVRWHADDVLGRPVPLHGGDREDDVVVRGRGIRRGHRIVVSDVHRVIEPRRNRRGLGVRGDQQQRRPDEKGGRYRDDDDGQSVTT